MGKIGVSAVPDLVETLKNEDSHVRECAARALGRIGVSAVPVLIKALKDRAVRMHAAKILHGLGNSVSLPRKILVSSWFSAPAKIEVLDSLRMVRGYSFDDSYTLCRTVLSEEDTKTYDGAQMVLNWLSGESPSASRSAVRPRK